MSRREPPKWHAAPSWRGLLEIPKTPRNIALIALLLLGILNFFSFIVGSVFLGRDAMNGRKEAGHYFLSDHGRLHEVSGAVFTYSLWHARSLFLSHPLAMIAAWLLFRGQKIAGR